MPRFLRGLVLAGALVPAGCGVGGDEARPPAEKPEVTRGRLAAMVLPQGELGQAGKGLRRDGESGLVPNDEAAEGTVDPDDTGKSLAGAGRRSGFRLSFEASGLAAAKQGAGYVSVGTEVELLEDTVYAAQYLHEQVSDFERFRGKRIDGVKLARVSTFEVADVGEESDGILVTAAGPGGTVHGTVVAFRRGRIVGAVTILRSDRADAKGEARALAVKLDRRIEGVLAGAIAPEPPSPEDKAREQQIADEQTLPDLTLDAADVGAEPVSEGPRDGNGYVAYARTYADVYASGAHLITLHAETQLYPSAKRAAAELRKVSKPAERRAYAQLVLERIRQAFGARPSDLRVEAVTGLGPGVVAVDVLFDSNGATFRFTTALVREGRAIQAVTGFCRALTFQPGDLRPLVRKARERLAV